MPWKARPAGSKTEHHILAFMFDVQKDGLDPSALPGSGDSYTRLQVLLRPYCEPSGP